jgi:signal transduction histidine kinase
MERPLEARLPSAIRDQPDGFDDGEAHRRLAAALVSTSDPAAALTAVCEAITQLTGCERVQVWRGDLRQLTMHAAIAVGYDPIDAERLRTLRLPMQDMPSTPDFLERKVLDIDHADALPDPSARLFADFGIRATTLALVERAERVLGALQLSWCRTPTPAFPPRSTIDVIRTYVALAVDMHARTDEALQAAATLSETAMLLASIRDPEVLLETMAQRITDALGCDLGAVYLVDEDTGLFRFAAGVGPAESLAVMRSIEGRPEAFAQLLAATDDDVVEYAATRDETTVSTHPLATAVASSLNVPLRRGDRLAGALALGYTARTGRFARRQVALAKGLAHHAAVALETARLVRSLEEANRVKSDFVAAVSHDLRTPIHILVGYADMLLDGAAGDLSAEQRALVDSIRERSFQFRDLVDGILAVARLDAQRDHSLASPTRLDQLCASVLRELDDRRAAGVTLRYRARPVMVDVDAPKVRMILRNLASNALKFTTAGEVVVAAEVEEAGLRLRVTDTGPGIDPLERAGIFEMFHQGSAARRAGGSGLGLGLYLVRRLAQVLGGTARLVQADPGRTCFEVVLPLPRATPPAAA